MTPAVGTNCRVAGVESDRVAVVAVLGFAGQNVIVFAVALVDMPAQLAALGQGDDRKHTALVIKLLGRLNYACEAYLTIAAEKIMCGVDFMLVFSCNHDFPFQLRRLPPTMIKNLKSCVSETARAAT